MNVITKEEYIKALDIVIQFNQQINLVITIDFNTLKVGDIIIFTESASQYVTIGKEYVVTYLNKDFKLNGYAWYEFIADNGKKKHLRKYARGYGVKIKN